MKVTVANPAYRTFCARIEPIVGSAIRLTNHVHDLAMSGGAVYLSGAGYQFTGYSATASFSPGAIDLEGIAGYAGVSRAAVGSGLFDGARVYIFATSWAAPIEDEEPILAGIFGKTTLLDGRYKIDGLTLIDALNQSVGKTHTAQCWKTFLSQGWAGCKVPAGPNTVTGTLTSVTSAAIFRDSARGEAADIFGAGTVRFTSGANAGLKAQEIRSYAAGGTIEIFEPFYYLPAVGDAYTMIRGCRKRLTDCQNRWNGTPFNNVVNFGGFPFIPTASTYAKFGQGGS